MLNLTSSEVRVLRVWAERGEESPFPQEMALVRRIKKNIANRNMDFTAKELAVVLHWADKETRGHHGMDRYLLEQEDLLLNKIENYLDEMDDRSVVP